MEINIVEFFESLGLIAGLVTIITGYLNTHISFLKEASGTAKQLVSWVVSLGVVFIGQAKGVGLLAGTDTLWTIITGIAVGLIANGIFDVKLVQSILSFIKANNGKKV